MDIPNLSTQTTTVSPKTPLNTTTIAIVLTLALTTGFWLSRFIPLTSNRSLPDQSNSPSTIKTVSLEEVYNTQDIKVGLLYGDSRHNFKDSAIGTLQKGGINNEGTHTLVRDGGKTQWASLTSSILDLDLFAERKVEVTGETNNSTKTGWLMDVSTIKILE